MAQRRNPANPYGYDNPDQDQQNADQPGFAPGDQGGGDQPYGVLPGSNDPTVGGNYQGQPPPGTPPSSDNPLPGWTPPGGNSEGPGGYTGAGGGSGSLPPGITPWAAPWQGTANTSGYSAPGWTADNYGNAPSGWDSAKWLDPQHQTPKYVVGRIFQSGQMAGKDIAGIAADIERAYPGSKWNGKDIIDIPGIGPVDFVRDFGGANGISWDPINDRPGAGGASPDINSILAMLSGGASSGGGKNPGGFAPPGGAPGGVGVGGDQSGGSHRDMIWSQIEKMLNGDMNQQRIDKRVGSARETLERQRKAEMDTAGSELGQRGLIGSGPEAQAVTQEGENIASQFGTQVRDIYSDESQRADQMTAQALSTATGLSLGESQQLIDQYSAETGRMVGMGHVQNEAEGNDIQRMLGLGRLDLDKVLGMGGLGIQQQGLDMDWNKFLADFGLRRDTHLDDVNSGQMGQYLQLLQLLLGSGGQNSGGFI